MEQRAEGNILQGRIPPAAVLDSDMDLGSQPDALLQTMQDKAYIVAQRRVCGTLQGAASMEYLLAFEGYGEEESEWFSYTTIAECVFRYGLSEQS